MAQVAGLGSPPATVDLVPEQTFDMLSRFTKHLSGKLQPSASRHVPEQ